MSFIFESEKPAFFKDLNKRLSDLLNKEYPAEYKVEWKAETDNTMVVEANLVQKNGGTIGTFTPKYKYKDLGADFTFEMNTKKEFKVEVSVADQLTKGLKLILAGNSKGGEIWASVGTEYKFDYGTFTFSGDYGREAGSNLKASATLGSKGWAFGGNAEYFVGSGGNELKEVNSIVGYNCDEFNVSGFGRMKNGAEEKNELGVSYYHGVNKELSVGTEISFDNSSLDSKPKLTFGTQYKLHEDTTLKGKFDTNGQLSLSFGQKFNRNAKFVLASSLDTYNAFGKGASPKIGFTISLSK